MQNFNKGMEQMFAGQLVFHGGVRPEEQASKGSQCSEAIPQKGFGEGS